MHLHMCRVQIPQKQVQHTYCSYSNDMFLKLCGTGVVHVQWYVHWTLRSISDGRLHLSQQGARLGDLLDAG